jgi:glycosyltransferase involved in cell wall biosynthesis
MNQPLPRRITVFSTDIPFPANRGGRADVWRRLQAMKLLGIEVQLVCFFDDLPGKRPSDADRAAVLAVVHSLHAFPIPKGLWHKARFMVKSIRAPWHVACRTLDTAVLHQLEQEVRRFDPSCIWCEGPWCGLNAQRLARKLTKPLVYRSHNIEHQYMRRQAKAARRWRDFAAWTVACIGLERFESALITSADWVFDISSDDMLFWQNKGLQRISWLPPIAEAALAPAPAGEQAVPVGDVVFLGNLTTPNNIRGVEWLVLDIAPLVREKRPHTSFVVAGSNPGDHVRNLCATNKVTLIQNPPDALSIYRGASVLVNPVRTGSGTHVKAIEMLMTSVPIVTATQGTCGLPNEVKQLFRVADSAPDFAGQILDALRTANDQSENRAVAREFFGVVGLRDALAALSARSGAK